MTPFHVRTPDAPPIPLVVSIPHTGTFVPDDLRARMTDAGRRGADADWFLHDLYDFVPSLGATLLCAKVHRYVIDLNRPSDGSALYPGRRETELCPTTTFADEAIWKPGSEPTPDEREDRRASYWQPYRSEISRLLEEASTRFGGAVLWEAHSIRSFVPRFSEARLPGFMLGDVDGTSAAPELSEGVSAVLLRSGLGLQRNHPFKGGHITRVFGRPTEGVHALQLEMSQRLYMDEDTLRWDEERAASLRPWLREALEAAAHFAQSVPLRRSSSTKAT